MKGKELQATIEWWTKCCEDSSKSMRDNAKKFDLHTPEQFGVYVDMMEQRKRDALAVAIKLLPYFNRHELSYFSDGVTLYFMDKTVPWGATMACFWTGNKLTLSESISNPKARKVINTALQALGIPARIGWRNGEPTITKGYKLDREWMGGGLGIIPLQSQP